MRIKYLPIYPFSSSGARGGLRGGPQRGGDGTAGRGEVEGEKDEKRKKGREEEEGQGTGYHAQILH